MNDYIKRDDALKIMKDAWMLHPSGDDAIQEAIDCISLLPAADVVERKKGKWIWDDEGYHCSECFYHAYGNTAEIYSGQYNYCPLCGSKNGDCDAEI